MEEKKETGIEKAGSNFLANLPTSAIAQRESEYNADEMAAGGDVEVRSPSSVFPYRVNISTGETGKYVFKRQSDQALIAEKASFSGIFLHAHRVFKLYQWMVDGKHKQAGFDKLKLSKEDEKVLAMTYDVPKKSRGSFDVSKNSDWLDNPKMFETIERYSRLFTYALVPGIVDPDSKDGLGVVYGSFGITAKSNYDKFLRDVKQKDECIAYCNVEFKLTKDRTASGVTYQRFTPVILNPVRYVDLLPRAELLSKLPEKHLNRKHIEIETVSLDDRGLGTLFVQIYIRPIMNEIQTLHRNLIESTEAGMIEKLIDIDDKHTDSTVPDEVF
jgi:hypothetical protein